MLEALRALAWRETIRWFRSPFAVFASLIFPVMYLLLFGQAFNLGKLLGFIPGLTPTEAAMEAFRGAPNYFSYFSVGMVGFVAVTASLFLGANVIFDKRLGFVKKTTAAPVPRFTIFGSRLIAGAFRPVLLGFLVLGMAALLAYIPGFNGLTVNTQVTALGVVEIILALVSVSLAFSALFLAMGFLFESPEGYFGIVNLLNLPILFTSAALYPTTTMPPWLQTISAFNPITLAVNVMRLNLFASVSPVTGSDYYPYSALVYLGGSLAYSFGLVLLSFWIAQRGLRPR